MRAFLIMRWAFWNDGVDEDRVFMVYLERVNWLNG